MKESFNSNVEAITHDSDPRQLHFQKMNADGTVADVSELGFDVNLSNAVPLGTVVPAIVGPTLLGLTGGAGNHFDLTFETGTAVTRPIQLSDLTAGIVTVSIFFDNSTTDRIDGNIHYNNIPTDINDITTRFTPIWSTETGKQITKVTYTVIDPFLAGTGTLTGLFFNLNVSLVGNFCTVNCLAPIGIEQTPVGSFPLTPDYTQPLNGVVPDELSPSGTITVPATTTISIPIDATSLLTTNALTWTAGQQVGNYFNFSAIAPFAGKRLIGINVVVDTAYGNSVATMDGAAKFDANVFVFGSPSSFDVITNLETTPPSQALPPLSFLPNTLQPGSPFAIFITLTPTSEDATTAPLLVTEPYEIRQRNLPAFLFTITPPAIPPDETSRSIFVRTFVSQGPTKNPESTDAPTFRWTQIPMQMFGTSAVNGTTNSINTLPVPDLFTDLPIEYSGNMLQPASGGNLLDFIGPWNYIRFIILKPLTDPDVDYSGFNLSITANAREVR